VKSHCGCGAGNSSGTQEGERRPLEAGTRGLVLDSKSRELCVYSELSSVRNRVRL
jgi:hypothetical protein